MSENYVIGGIIAAVVVWLLRSKLGINIPLPALPKAPPVPLPDDTPTTERPVLDWMTVVLLTQYGNDPKVAAAIRAEVEAIKRILDAANIPPLMEKKL